ncbi:N-formylglutamate deformylase [Marinicella pacifica]|uniref:N-formylglutamate deformylase n=1 Tax=Marinicella pacifica TaxID=1171543 RepID=A0A917FPQ0_9GAMM|nr:N-formylglutamate amidohydrolase [Marinicella pacifica]GGF93752.1 N-formylglutamate deformylase [Marinicella pacifica]
MSVFALSEIGAPSPLVISVPHDGDKMAPGMVKRLQPYAADCPDRDHLIARVFDFKDLPHTRIKAEYSRYVVDLNRPASGDALYPGQSETGVCPITGFDDRPLYRSGREPDDQEIKQRIEKYWQPYHHELAKLIDRAKNRFGYCLLIDAHSIDDVVPRFFKGFLPHINVGTFGGKSCDAQYQNIITDALSQQDRYSWVINDRFKGGYITRHYGQPEKNVHAIQLEHGKSIYAESLQKLSHKADALINFWYNTLKKFISHTQNGSKV